MWGIYYAIWNQPDYKLKANTGKSKSKIRQAVQFSNRLEFYLKIQPMNGCNKEGYNKLI